MVKKNKFGKIIIGILLLFILVNYTNNQGQSIGGLSMCSFAKCGYDDECGMSEECVCTSGCNEFEFSVYSCVELTCGIMPNGEMTSLAHCINDNGRISHTCMSEAKLELLSQQGAECYFV